MEVKRKSNMRTSKDNSQVRVKYWYPGRRG